MSKYTKCGKRAQQDFLKNKQFSKKTMEAMAMCKGKKKEQYGRQRELGETLVYHFYNKRNLLKEVKVR